MRQTLFYFVHTVLLIATVGGCATTRDLKNRVDVLEEEVNDLRRSNALSSQQLREYDRLSQMTFLLQDTLEQLSLEIDQIRTQQESAQGQIKALELGLYGTESNIVVNRVEPKKPLAKQPLETKTTTPAAYEPTAKEILVSDGLQNPRTIYQDAYRAMETGQVDHALKTFELLIKEFPTSDLADNAYFWIGSLYQQLGSVEQARYYFEYVVEHYTSSNKVPDAIFKLGELAEADKDLQTAISWYRKVMEEFAWAPAAEKAEARMKKLLNKK